MAAPARMGAVYQPCADCARTVARLAPVTLLGAKTFQNYIGGEWVDSASGETFESTSPATGDTIGVFPRSNGEDVDRAVAAAREAFEEWRLVPAPKRGEVLYRFANLMMEEKDELTDLMTHEMGKVKAEAGGGVQEAIDMSLYMAGGGGRPLRPDPPPGGGGQM